MTQTETIVGSSLLLWFCGQQLSAEKGPTEQANWDSLKTLTEGQEIKVVLNDVKAYQPVPKCE